MVFVFWAAGSGEAGERTDWGRGTDQQTKGAGAKNRAGAPGSLAAATIGFGASPSGLRAYRILTKRRAGEEEF